MPPRQIDLGGSPFIVSPDGRRYVQMIDRTPYPPRRTLVIRDLPSLRESGRLDVTALIQADFSPDGRRLLLSSVRLIEPAQRTGILLWLKERIPALFPPDPGWQDLHEIRLLDPATAAPPATIRLSDPIWQQPQCLFSPDGKTLAVWYTKGTGYEPDLSDRPATIELWDVPPRKPLGLTLGAPITLTLLAVLLGRKVEARRRLTA